MKVFGVPAATPLSRTLSLIHGQPWKTVLHNHGEEGSTTPMPDKRAAMKIGFSGRPNWASCRFLL
jgi:hypothetical protein